VRNLNLKGRIFLGKWEEKIRRSMLVASRALRSLFAASVLAVFVAAPDQSLAADLTTLVSFDYANGKFPFAGLIADANGNLFGTTAFGGAYGNGTVFEVAKTASGYDSNPSTLVNFCFDLPLCPHGANSGSWPDHRRQPQPLRHDPSGRGVWELRHGVRGRQDRKRLRQHPHRPGELLRAP
jgi:uncharacterized repeat protein (TIGR03803 family)